MRCFRRAVPMPPLLQGARASHLSAPWCFTRAWAGLHALRCLACVAGLIALSAPAIGTTFLPIARVGDPVEGLAIPLDGSFHVGPLNDAGQLCLIAETESGEQLLLQYGAGKLTPVVLPGGEGPLGKWPQTLWLYPPPGMNRHGFILFSGLLVSGSGGPAAGTFLWEAVSRKLVPIALPGMQFAADQLLDWAGGPSPVVNGRGEIALVVNVRSASGRSFPGIFHRDAEGRLTPVALPDQRLPGGGRVAFAVRPSLTDAGTLAFLVRRQGAELEQPYLWERGRLTALPVSGVTVPRGLDFERFSGIWLNNGNRTALLSGELHSSSSRQHRHHVALYRFASGRIRPVVLPGQPMPGGGRFETVQEMGVSTGNDRGQHAFLATLEDGATACYLLEPDGGLSLLLKSGAGTDLGTVTGVGHGSSGSRGVGLNNRGEVALTISLADGPDAVVLLSPS